MEVDQLGQIYFIGSTHYGSSLFKINQHNEVVRLFKADNIVDAKLINQNQFVIETVTDSNFQFLISSTDFKQIQMPYVFQYAFDKSSHRQKLTPAVKKNFKNSKINNASIHPYNSLTQLKFANWWFGYTLTTISEENNKQDLQLEGLLQFTDPLLQNTLSFSISDRSYFDTTSFFFDYTNQRHRLIWGYSYKSEPISQLVNGIVTNKYDVFTNSLNFKYPLFLLGHWRLNAVSSLQDESNKYLNKNIFKTAIGFDINYKREYSLSFKPETNYNLRLLTAKVEDNSLTVSDVYFHKDLYFQSYLSVGSKLLQADGPIISVSSSSSEDFDSIYIQTISTILNTDFAQISYIKLQQTFEYGAYWNFFGLGFRDLSPFVQATHNRFKDSEKLNKSEINELSYGLDGNIIIAHKFIIPLSLTLTEDLKTGDNNLAFKFSYLKDF